MKIKKLTTNQLKKLREYLFTKRLRATNKEEWQKYVDMSDEVSKELQVRRLGGESSVCKHIGRRIENSNKRSAGRYGVYVR
ncbi:hypothetical protein A3Q05_04685 [Lactobacillus johnsonii]|uniref:Uncharacterized protein n=1 Tax=Lactobacillus johnsonii TaxID=33959 RepID=A0A267M873_LACJH|nr:hypothetical protein [Lactobacillus johnsonii]PAB55485.1 hypothetical protein A3Q05_04685 [Lactobacillus johnsonii]PAB55776.1 hypothetical protein A3Q24_03400 [Lactobacillus johnsonii]PEG68865.1 hypothetical protein A3Q04_07080 [Lactobacillus johnsonii]